MDWSLFFAAASFGVILTTAISSATFFIIRLMIQPLKDDIAEMKITLAQVKSETEIETLMDLKVARHKEECTPTIRKLIEQKCQ